MQNEVFLSQPKKMPALASPLIWASRGPYLKACWHHLYEEPVKISEILNKFQAQWSPSGPNSKTWVKPAERHGQQDQSLCPEWKNTWSFSKPTEELAVSSACSSSSPYSSLLCRHGQNCRARLCVWDFPVYMEELHGESSPGRSKWPCPDPHSSSERTEWCPSPERSPVGTRIYGHINLTSSGLSEEWELTCSWCK